MAKELMKTTFKREAGKLYYLSTSNDGFLVLCETDMKRRGRPKKNK